MDFINPNEQLPRSGFKILIKLKDNNVYEGHFIRHINKYHMNVNRWRIYDPAYSKTLATAEIEGWAHVSNK